MKRNTNRHRSDDNFLHAMEGKVITVYRGGPESKTGRLADIQSDYIALQVDNKIVYYQWKHVKSVTENTSETVSPAESAECEKADDFQELIERMTNRTVQLNQGGPESKRGKLHETGDDFLVLETEDDGIVYFNIDHVKSISAEQEDEGEQEDERTEFEMADDFHGIFKRLIHKWVSINRGGPEAVEGILVDNSDGHYTLVKDKEVLRIHPLHIKSISAGAKGAAKKEENKNENQGEKECAEEESHEEQHTSSEKSKRSSKADRSSKRDEEDSYSYATVLRTIDYRWKRGRK
ncbi:spore coat protein [Bacillus amyloliquefaciens]|uniref:DUF6897 domain-containing protein n=1 Tax=Bacillus amyloliquefaciens TaxID=1390 RepID=UPI00336B0601